MLDRRSIAAIRSRYDLTTEDGLVSKYFHDREEAINYLSEAGKEASFRATTLEDVFVDCAGRKLQ